MGEMSPRQRILAALRLEEPDRVPLWPYAHILDPYNKRKMTSEDPRVQHLTELTRKKCDILHWWDPPSIHYGQMKNEAEGPVFLSGIKVKQKVQKYVEGKSDVVEHIIETPKGPLNTIWKRSVERLTGYASYYRTKHYIKTQEDLNRFLSLKYQPFKPNLSSFFEEERRIGEKGIMWILAPTADLIVPDALISTEDLVVKSYREKDAVLQLFDVIHQRCIDYLEYVLSKGVKDLYSIGGPEYFSHIFPPRFFHDYVVKYDSQIIKLIHDYDALVEIHCHGRINALLETIASMRPDALHPIDPPPIGDTPLYEAKRRIGDKMCLNGNIQVGDMIICPEEEIEQKVKNAIFDAAPGGGFILTVSANPHWDPFPDLAYRNYMKFIEAGKEYGSGSFRIE